MKSRKSMNEICRDIVDKWSKMSEAEFRAMIDSVPYDPNSLGAQIVEAEEFMKDFVQKNSVEVYFGQFSFWQRLQICWHVLRGRSINMMKGVAPDVKVRREEYTCSNCGEKDFCPYAFDDYNTDGDCLAIK